MYGLSPALIIGLDRLLTSTVDNHSWLKGVIIALLAALCSSLGFCLQNLSQKSNLALPIQKQITPAHQPMNLAGIGLVIADSLLECVALTYANESLLASIGLSTLAFNVILSPIINGEKATYVDWVVVGQIITGVLITICTGPHRFQLLSIHQIEVLLHSSSFHMFVIIVCTWTFGLLYLTMVFDPADTLTGRLASLTRPQRYELHRLCLCALAGSFAGLTITAVRGSVSLIAISLENNNQFTDLGSWIFIITTIMLAAANIVTMNHAVGLYENLYVIPAKSVFEVLIGVAGGMFFYKESMSLSYAEIAFFALGLGFCVSGLAVMLFASRRLPAYEAAYLGLVEKSVQNQEKQSLLLRIRV